MTSKYARLPTRVKAAIIDSIVLILLMYSASEILNLLGTIPNYVRTTIFLIIFVFLEPILVSIFGATVGHFFSDIVVKRQNDEKKNINFLVALIRYILKILLGWLSLLTITGNDKQQAIHDLAANSVVKQYEKITK
jgi:uncharacterized RDD family membrane protein YckC